MGPLSSPADPCFGLPNGGNQLRPTRSPSRSLSITVCLAVNVPKQHVLLPARPLCFSPQSFATINMPICFGAAHRLVSLPRKKLSTRMALAWSEVKCWCKLSCMKAAFRLLWSRWALTGKLAQLPTRKLVSRVPSCLNSVQSFLSNSSTRLPLWHPANLSAHCAWTVFMSCLQVQQFSASRLSSAKFRVRRSPGFFQGCP